MIYELEARVFDDGIAYVFYHNSYLKYYLLCLFNTKSDLNYLNYFQPIINQ